MKKIDPDASIALILGPAEQPIEIVLPKDHGVAVVAMEVFNSNCYAPVAGTRDIKTIVDIGANAGIASTYFRFKYPEASITCFEPDQSIFPYLFHNASIIGNCKPHNFGLFNCDAKLDFFTLGGTSVLSSFKEESGGTAVPGGIAVRNVNHAFSELGIGHIDLLKIDTEGSEIPILHTMRKDLLAGIELIHLEFHSRLDRLLLDCMLSQTHVLWVSDIHDMNRGQLTYVNRNSPALSHASPAL